MCACRLWRFRNWTDTNDLVLYIRYNAPGNSTNLKPQHIWYSIFKMLSMHLFYINAPVLHYYKVSIGLSLLYHTHQRLQNYFFNRYKQQKDWDIRQWLIPLKWLINIHIQLNKPYKILLVITKKHIVMKKKPA